MPTMIVICNFQFRVEWTKNMMISISFESLLNNCEIPVTN